MTVRPDTKTGIIHKFKSSIFHLDKDYGIIVYLLWFGICLIRIFNSTQTVYCESMRNILCIMIFDIVLNPIIMLNYRTLGTCV